MGNIVWLASYPKSGNTWLRAFIANLIANRPTAVPLAELPNYGDLEARPDLFSQLAGRPNTELDFAQISELRPRVHAMIAAAAPKTVFVKTHNLAGVSDGHPLHNPTVSAGAIYVVRNPLDVVISMSHHFGIGIDEAIAFMGNPDAALENSELFVTQFLGTWSQHVAGWTALEGPRIISLRYEDMLEKPIKAFTKVARLIGIDQDRARIERAVKHASFSSLASMEKRDGFVEVPIKGKHFFRSGRVNQWREILTRDQISRVISDHRDVMSRMRYLPAGY